jgi:DNA primase
MAYIPEDKLLEIKDAASLEEVVGQVVKLVRRGKNLVGLCPFHADTAPSFTVSPDRGLFHCFGCGAHGNVFSFLMQHQRLSFPEAAQELARRYGITLTLRDLGPEGAKLTRKRQAMQEINKEAAAFYAGFLKGPEGKAGRDYLQKRGLTPEIIEAFHLGYAPEAWDGLRRHLQGRNLSLDAAQEVGLLIAKEQGGHYDRFRGRIIFPIADRQGRVIAFGGRLVGPGEPKYLNSPESPLYSKGRNLYGLPQAAEALRQTGVALVVEGYLDLIALQVHGIANVVATLGTALTKEQVRLLKSLAPKAVLVFDGDAAGARAMQKALPLFAQEGLPVRVLPLPPGLDPDDYAAKHGVEIFNSPWEAAQPWFAYLLEELISVHGLDIEGRVRILGELSPYFQAVADPVEQGLWLRLAARRLGVEEAAIRLSLASGAPLACRPLDRSGQVLVSLEKALLRWFLHHPEAVPLSELEEWLLEFKDQNFQGILSLIIQHYRKHGGLDHCLLIQQVEAEEVRQQICILTLGDEEFSGPATAALAADWRRNLHIRRLTKDQARLKEKLATADVRPGSEDLGALLAQRREIDRQLEALKKCSTEKGEPG